MTEGKFSCFHFLQATEEQPAEEEEAEEPATHETEPVNEEPTQGFLWVSVCREFRNLFICMAFLEPHLKCRSNFPGCWCRLLVSVVVPVLRKKSVSPNLSPSQNQNQKYQSQSLLPVLPAHPHPELLFGISTCESKKSFFIDRQGLFLGMYFLQNHEFGQTQWPSTWFWRGFRPIHLRPIPTRGRDHGGQCWFPRQFSVFSR